MLTEIELNENGDMELNVEPTKEGVLTIDLSEALEKGLSEKDIRKDIIDFVETNIKTLADLKILESIVDIVNIPQPLRNSEIHESMTIGEVDRIQKLSMKAHILEGRIRHEIFAVSGNKHVLKRIIGLEYPILNEAVIYEIIDEASSIWSNDKKWIDNVEQIIEFTLNVFSLQFDKEG